MKRQETFVIEDEPWLSEASWNSLIWFLFLAAAWLLFELTANAALSIIVSCSKVGWKDLRIGLWLRRNDADRSRGKTCSWFYWAAAFFKITLASFLIGVLVSMVTQAANQRGVRPPVEAVASIFMMIVCLVLSISIMVLAIILAVGRRKKIWLDSTIHTSRKSGVWPPRPYGKNRLALLVLTTIVIPLVMILIIGMLGQVPGQPGAAAALIMMLVFFVVVALFALITQTRILAWIGARHPTDCWPELATEDNGYWLTDSGSVAASAGDDSVWPADSGSSSADSNSLADLM